MSDVELTGGDALEPGPAGFEDFFRRHWLSMVRLAGLLVDDVATAEDVAQNAFVSYQRRRGSLRTPEADLAYLRTCVVNGSRSTLRRRAVARRHASRSAELMFASPDTAILETPENSELVAIIRELPRRQREVLILRYWLDLAHAEVAQLLGVSTSTAKSTASRALDALELSLKEKP